MVGWIILGVILALLLLILLIPVGADLGYEGGKLHVSAKLGPMLVQIFPRQRGEGKPKKEKKPKKKKEEPQEEEEEEEQEKKPKKKRSLPFNRDEILELLQIALKTLGKFGRAWRVDRFLLHFTAASQDPYDTAMMSAYADSAVAALAPLCRQTFKVKDSDVWTAVDFTRDFPEVEIGLALTINLWRIFGVVNCLLFGALKVLLKSKKRRKQEAKAAKQSGETEPKDETKAPENGSDTAAETATAGIGAQDPAGAAETGAGDAAAKSPAQEATETPSAPDKQEKRDK